MDVEKTVSAPEHFTISQNYPNPFNSRTGIDVHIPINNSNSTKFEFIIYDLLGKILYKNKYNQ